MKTSRLTLGLLAAGTALFLTGLAGERAFRNGPPASPLSKSRAPDRIEVRRPREDVILETGEGRWRVERQGNDFADSEAVESLLSGLRALAFGPAADDGASALAYGLGPADSTRVRVLDRSGSVLFDGRFGRRAFARSAWFRASDRDAIRLASGLDADLLARSSAEWRERRLLPGGCPEGLEFQRGKTWLKAPEETAKELCALKAARFADGADEAVAGFDKPLLVARAADGRSFEVGDRRGGERLVRVAGRFALLRAPAGPLEAAAYLLRSMP